MRNALIGCCALLVTAAAGSQVVQAGTGDFDPGFGSGGVMVLPTTANAHLPLPDGRIIVARHATPAEAMPLGIVTILARLNPDGSSDPGFGTNGVVPLPLDLYHTVRLVAQPDGKLLVLGTMARTCNQGDSCSSLAIIRRLPDGSPDLSFGDGGTASAEFGPNAANASGLNLLDDGRILVTGSYLRETGNQQNEVFALARYLPSGQPDATFGVQGKVFTSLGGMSDRLLGVTVLADRSLLVAGTGNWQAALVRYDANGATDAAFGTNGKILSSMGADGAGMRTTLPLPDGRFLATGYYCFFTSEFPNCNQATLRYLPEGSLDPSFANGGWGIPELWDVGGEIAVTDVDASGRILVLTATPPRLLRFNADGTWDRSFGDDGWLPLDMDSVASGTVLPGGTWLLRGNRAGHDVLARMLVDPQDNGQRNVPVTPRSGLWAVAAELNGLPGRGIQVDYQDGTLVAVVNGYEPDGHSGFWLASGSLVGGSFAGNLQAFKAGTPFGGALRSAIPAESPGQISLTFSSSTAGTVRFPGEPERTIRKLDVGAAPTMNTAMTAVPGIWAIQSELDGKPGRGFMLESFGNNLAVIVDGYEYSGRAAFYLAGGEVKGSRFDASLMAYQGGTPFGQSYRPASAAGAAGNISIKLITGSWGEITLPGESTRTITKFHFGR